MIPLEAIPTLPTVRTQPRSSVLGADPVRWGLSYEGGRHGSGQRAWPVVGALESEAQCCPAPTGLHVIPASLLADVATHAAPFS